MWHLTKIPKIAHYFWDDRPLSFLRWLSMYTFSTLNPDWKLKLHITKKKYNPSWPSANNKHNFVAGDYRGWLDKIKLLEIIEENDLSRLHGVHQSDILRNQYLSIDGGLWSDIDILYYKPMNSLICNRPENANADCGLCVVNSRWMPIAFMLSAPKSAYFQAVYKHQMAILRTSGNRGVYQKFGTKIYQYVLNNENHSFFHIAPTEVYQCNWKMHHKIFSGDIRLKIGIGIHWYGGSISAAKFEPLIHHENWQEFPIKRIIEVAYDAENHSSNPHVDPKSPSSMESLESAQRTQR